MAGPLQGQCEAGSPGQWGRTRSGLLFTSHSCLMFSGPVADARILFVSVLRGCEPAALGHSMRRKALSSHCRGGGSNLSGGLPLGAEQAAAFQWSPLVLERAQLLCLGCRMRASGPGE